MTESLHSCAMGVIAEWQTAGSLQYEIQERHPALADALDDLVTQYLREEAHRSGKPHHA